MNETFGKVTQVIKDHTSVALLQWAKKLQFMLEERRRRIKQLENNLAMLKSIQAQVDETTVLVNSNQVKLMIIIRSLRSGLSSLYVPKDEYKAWAASKGNTIYCQHSYDAGSENENDHIKSFRHISTLDVTAISNLTKYFGGYNNEP